MDFHVGAGRLVGQVRANGAEPHETVGWQDEITGENNLAGEQVLETGGSFRNPPVDGLVGEVVERDHAGSIVLALVGGYAFRGVGEFPPGEIAQAKEGMALAYGNHVPDLV